MGRIMALDIGEKTIGVAFLDESAPIAFPAETILRQEGYRRDMAVLRRLIAERDVRRIVVGMPLLPDGSHGMQAAKVEAFVDRLRDSVRIPIDRQDEGYTTAGAEAILDELGRPRAAHKLTVDSVAACLILQDYMIARQATRSPSMAPQSGQTANTLGGYGMPRDNDLVQDNLTPVENVTSRARRADAKETD